MVTQKRPGRSKKTWDEVLVDDRKKVRMDSVDLENLFEWGGRLRGRFVNNDQPLVEENIL